VKTGLLANPPPPTSGKRGQTAQGSTRNLLIRLRDFRSEILLFAKKKNVPFDNILAERDLRMFKLKAKVSGCFRSEPGVVAFCRICSYIATAHKRNISMYQALVSLANGCPMQA